MSSLDFKALHQERSVPATHFTDGETEALQSLSDRDEGTWGLVPFPPDFVHHLGK